nr:MAG: capsid protein [Chemarfal virus 137]
MAAFIHDMKNQISPARFYDWAAWNPVTLNISTSDSAEITYHWMCPETFMAVDTMGTSGRQQIGQMSIQQLVPIESADGNTDVPFQVFAQFKSPRVAGFRYANAQSGEKFPAKSTALTKTPEIAEKDSMGTLVLGTASIASSLFKSIPVVGDVYSEVAKFVKTVAGVMDKPRSLQMPQKMVESPTTEWQYGSGASLADRLSLYPTSNLARPTISPECMSTNHSVAELAGVPLIHEIFRFTSTATSLEIGLSPTYQGSVTNSNGGKVIYPDYLCSMAMIHEMWRGSIKYYLQFITNGFTTARFRIAYLVDNSTPDFIGGDFPTQIVEVKGTTYADVLVPYLWASPWRKVVTPFPAQTDAYVPNLYPKMSIQLISSPNSFGSDPSITLVVWRAGGPDIQFQFLKTFPNHPPPMAEAQTSIGGKFKENFKPITCDCTLSVESGYTSSEPTGKQIDVMKRTYPTQNWLPLLHDTDQYYSQIPLFMIANLYRYQRGSLQYKTVVDSQGAKGVFYSNGTALQDGSGFFLVPEGIKPVSVEVPYYELVPYQPVDADSTYTPMIHEIGLTVGTITPPETQFTSMSVGDDFYMFYLMNPPSVEINQTKRRTTIRKRPKANLI